MASTEPLNWKIIRNELRDGDIIPVIGPELLSVNINGQQQSFRHWLANELAKELGVTFDGLDGFLHPVEEVMLRHYVQGDIRSNKPYQLVKALISEQKFEVPEALKKLAQISKFRFFLTTFYEPFLEMAIKEARGLSDNQIRVLENNLIMQPDDLTLFTQRSAMQQFDPWYIENLYKNTAPPTIYYLYGRPSRTRSFALSEDDVLEAFLMLQSSIYRPDELINFISGKRLLVLGCNFPNWLARFFISLTSPDPKKPSIQPVFVMSDTVCRMDQNLSRYLKRIDAQVVLDASVETFIDELYELWKDIEGQTGESPVADNPFENQSVFISYASEDRDAANQLYEEIKSIGVPVWLDKKALTPGEAWSVGIESNLANCSVFLPLISSASLITNPDRFCRKEWEMAIQLSKDSSGVKPIIPVQISQIPRDSSDIPEYLRELHWIDAPGGKISDKGLFQIKEAFEKSKR